MVFVQFSKGACSPLRGEEPLSKKPHPALEGPGLTLSGSLFLLFPEAKGTGRGLEGNLEAWAGDKRVWKAD